jgi:hypothetical protein
MMTDYLEPTTRPILWTATGLLSGETHTVTGETRVGDATGTSLAFIASEDENEYLSLLDATLFPPLPDSGWLEAGEHYAYGDGVVIVRQAHSRTIYPPADTPALFMVYREDADAALEWVAGESVYVGTQRLYDGIVYECIQAHVTQADWTPPAVPALWRVLPEPSAEWQAWVWYDIGDRVLYGGIEYECRQAHTSQPGWEPPNVPALWMAV